MKPQADDGGAEEGWQPLGAFIWGSPLSRIGWKGLKLTTLL